MSYVLSLMLAILAIQIYATNHLATFEPFCLLVFLRTWETYKSCYVQFKTGELCLLLCVFQDTRARFRNDNICIFYCVCFKTCQTSRSSCVLFKTKETSILLCLFQDWVDMKLLLCPVQDFGDMHILSCLFQDRVNSRRLQYIFTSPF